MGNSPQIACGNVSWPNVCVLTLTMNVHTETAPSLLIIPLKTMQARAHDFHSIRDQA